MSGPRPSMSLACRTCSCRRAAERLPEKERRFEAGLLDLRKRQGLYAEHPHGVEISEGVLYRARISIPSQVPVGTYTAETFLVDDGKVIAAATREIEIGKSGFRAVGRAGRAAAWLPLRPGSGAAVARPWLGGSCHIPAPPLGQNRPSKANLNPSRLIRTQP